MIADKIAETSDHQFFHWKWFWWGEYLFEGFQVFFLKRYQVFSFQEFCDYLLQKISCEQSHSLIFMSAQLNVVISQLIPENIQYFQTSVRIQLQNFINFLEAKRAAGVVSFISTSSQKCSQEANKLIKMQFGCFLNKVFDIRVKEIHFIILNSDSCVFSTSLIFFDGFGAVEFTYQVHNCLPLITNMLWELSSPFQHCFHEQDLFVGVGFLDLVPYFLDSSFDDTLNKPFVAQLQSWLDKL